MAENDNDLAKSLSSKDLAGSLRKANFSNLEDGAKAGSDFNEIDLVMDVPVQVTVELGRAKMQIRNLLNLTYGSVIELDILAGEPLGSCEWLFSRSGRGGDRERSLRYSLNGYCYSGRAPAQN